MTQNSLYVDTGWWGAAPVPKNWGKKLVPQHCLLAVAPEVAGVGASEGWGQVR